METRVLNYFLKISQLNNMTKAAEELHIAQPTLSRQIKSLEDNLGVKLFNRNNKKMTLTTAGIIFQKRAQQIVELANKAEQDVSDQSELSGMISIGCIESSVSNFLGTMISKFHKLYPKVKFSLYDADGDDIREKIDRGTVDLGFVMTPIEVAKYHSLDLSIIDHWCLALPKDHPLSKQAKILMDDLKRLPLIIPSRHIVQNEILSWFNARTSDLNIVASQNLVGSSLSLINDKVAYPICISGVSAYKLSPDLVVIPIDTQTVVNHVMIWRKNYALSHSTLAFIEFIENELNNSGRK